MSTDEILDKYGVVFENFCPAPNAAIKVEIDLDKISIEIAGKIAETIHEIYPEHSMFTTFKGMSVK